VTVGVSLPVTPSIRQVLSSHEVAFNHVYRTTSSAHRNLTNMVSFLILKPSQYVCRSSGKLPERKYIVILVLNK
jgi:hypothetical protein